MIKEKNYGLKIRNKLVHRWWLTTVSLPGMGQPWKIITLSSNQWASTEQKLFLGVKKRPRKWWRHHADLPPSGCYKISNSNPMLSQNSQPPQGSQSVDTWRTWSQHCRQVKYNSPVRLGPRNTLFLRTWWVPEKGKGGKSLVPRNDSLKGGKNESLFKSVGTPNLVTCRTSNKKSLHA